MDLNVLAQLAQLLGGISVLAALVFGIAQLRQYRQQRQDAAGIELVRSLQDGESMRAFRLIYTLPNEVSASELRSRGPEYEDAAFLLCAKFETVGLLVFHGSIPYDLVEELVGGATVHVWRKLQPWTDEIRKTQGQALLWEWFQWLAERLAAGQSSDAVPAYERYAEWTPK